MGNLSISANKSEITKPQAINLKNAIMNLIEQNNLEIEINFYYSEVL